MCRSGPRRRLSTEADVLTIRVHLAAVTEQRISGPLISM